MNKIILYINFDSIDGLYCKLEECPVFCFYMYNCLHEGALTYNVVGGLQTVHPSMGHRPAWVRGSRSAHGREAISVFQKVDSTQERSHQHPRHMNTSWPSGLCKWFGEIKSSQWSWVSLNIDANKPFLESPVHIHKLSLYIKSINSFVYFISALQPWRCRDRGAALLVSWTHTSPPGCQKTRGALQSWVQRWRRCVHRGWPSRGTFGAPTPTHSLGCGSTLGLGTPKGLPALPGSSNSCTFAAWVQRGPRSHLCMACPKACS